MPYQPSSMSCIEGDLGVLLHSKKADFVTNMKLAQP